jgi:hypothetical protein
MHRFGAAKFLIRTLLLLIILGTFTNCEKIEEYFQIRDIRKMAETGDWDQLRSLYAGLVGSEGGTPILDKSVKDSLIAITFEYNLADGMEYFEKLLYEEPLHRRNKTILHQYYTRSIDIPIQDLITYYSYLQNRKRPAKVMYYIPLILRGVEDSLMIKSFTDYVDILADLDTTSKSFQAKLDLFTVRWKKEYYPNYKDCLLAIPRIVSDSRTLTFKHLMPLVNQMIRDGNYKHALKWSRTMKGVPPQFIEVKDLFAERRELEIEAERLKEKLVSGQEDLKNASEERKDCFYLTGSIVAELSHTEGMATEYEINTSRGRAILFTRQTRYSRKGSFGLRVIQMDYKQEVKVSGGFTQHWPVFTESPMCKDSYLTEIQSQKAATEAALKKNRAALAKMDKKIRTVLESTEAE